MNIGERFVIQKDWLSGLGGQIGAGEDQMWQHQGQGCTWVRAVRGARVRQGAPAGMLRTRVSPLPPPLSSGKWREKKEDVMSR